VDASREFAERPGRVGDDEVAVIPKPMVILDLFQRTARPCRDDFDLRHALTAIGSHGSMHITDY